MQESQIILQIPPYNNFYVDLKTLSGQYYTRAYDWEYLLINSEGTM